MLGVLIIYLFPIVLIVLSIVLIVRKVKIRKQNSQQKQPQQLPPNNIVTNSNDTNLPYQICNRLLTDHELAFYKQLRPLAERNGYTVMCKVRLADIALIPEGTQNYIKWFRKVSQKHIDFLICTLNSEPVCAIELDDYTHNWESTKERDEIKNKIFKNKKIKLYRYREWTIEQLQQDLSLY